VLAAPRYGGAGSCVGAREDRECLCCASHAGGAADGAFRVPQRGGSDQNKCVLQRDSAAAERVPDTNPQHADRPGVGGARVFCAAVLQLLPFLLLLAGHEAAPRAVGRRQRRAPRERCGHGALSGALQSPAPGLYARVPVRARVRLCRRGLWMYLQLRFAGARGL